MTLTDDALARSRATGAVCGVQKLLKTLSPSEQAEVNDALASAASARGIAEEVRLRGWFPVGDQTIQRHRLGTCRCGR